MTLNQKLVILRKKAGMTQEDLSRALDVSRQSVHKWESGQCYPEVPKLIGMKAIFGISIDDLLDDSVDIALPEKKKSRRIKTVSAEETEPEKTEAVKEEEKPSPMPSAPVIPEIKEEPTPVIEEIEVEVIEEVKEPVPEKAEPSVREVKPEAVHKPLSDAPKQEPEKKKGFFAKIFGKK